MAQTRRSNRRSSKLNKTSLSLRELNSDTNVFENDNPLWWKRLDDHTIIPSRRQSSLINETTACLENDSQIQTTQPVEEWWKLLDASNNTNTNLSHSKKAPTKKLATEPIKHLLPSSTSSDSEDEIKIRKKKVPLHISTKNIRSSNAFAQVLNSPIITTPKRSKKRDLSHSNASEHLQNEKQGGTYKSYGDQSNITPTISTSGSETEINVRKKKPPFRDMLRKSRGHNVFLSALDHSDKEAASEEKAVLKNSQLSSDWMLLHESQNNELCVSQNSGCSKANNSQSIQYTKPDTVNTSHAKEGEENSQLHIAVDNDSDNDTSKSENYSAILRPKGRFVRSKKKSLNTNVFRDVLRNELNKSMNEVQDSVHEKSNGEPETVSNLSHTSSRRSIKRKNSDKIEPINHSDNVDVLGSIDEEKEKSQLFVFPNNKEEETKNYSQNNKSAVKSNKETSSTSDLIKLRAQILRSSRPSFQRYNSDQAIVYATESETDADAMQLQVSSSESNNSENIALQKPLNKVVNINSVQTPTTSPQSRKSRTSFQSHQTIDKTSNDRDLLCEFSHEPDEVYKTHGNSNKETLQTLNEQCILRNNRSDIPEKRKKNILDFFGVRGSRNTETFKKNEAAPLNSKVSLSQLEEVRKKIQALDQIKTKNKNAISKNDVALKHPFKTGNAKKEVRTKTQDPSTKPLSEVDKAYLVDGKVYKKPKLLRPKYWVTDRLYNFLWKQLEPKYKLKTRTQAEKFVQELTGVYTIIMRRKKYDSYKEHLVALMKEMARLNLIKNRKDFYDFCYEYLPREIFDKVVPVMRPGNKLTIPYDPETLYTPLIEE